YQVRADGPFWSAADMFKPNNNYLIGYIFYDGFLRSRQTQTLGNGEPGKPPLRVLTDSLYDSHGLKFQDNGPYADADTPGTNLVGVDDASLAKLTRTTYDGADRPTVTAPMSQG